MIKAVIFDMDGVIIDSEGTYLEYEMEFAKKKNPDIKIEQLFPMVGATKQNSWEVLERAVHNGQSWDELRNEFRKHDIYGEIDYKKLFRPEIVDVLKTLKRDGYSLAVASSTQLDLVERVLLENEIRQYFEVVVSGNQFERGKPDPEIYQYTAGQLGMKTDMCLAVEDSTIGITAAYRAGMKVAAVIDNRYQFDQQLADFHLNRVKDVLEVVKHA